MRAFAQLWDELTRERYGVEDPKHRRFRYGVQVNSLGPDRGAAGEQRPADRAGDARPSRCPRDARARAVQLPAWNEALGLPRPWDQQWSLRHAAGAGLRVRPARVRGPVRPGRSSSSARSPRSSTGARAEIARVQEMGGAVAAVESGYMKGAAGRARWPSGAAGWSAARTSWSASTGSQTTEPNPLTGRPRRRDHDGRPGRRERGAGGRARSGGPSATRRRSTRRSARAARGRRRPTPT